MQRLLAKSVGDFRRSYGKYLSFELLFSLFASFLFAPFLTYIFNRLLIMFRSSPTLINNEVFSFGFSFNGLILLFVISLFILSMLFIEFGVIVIIAHQTYFRQPIYIGDAIKTALCKFPKLIGLGLFQMMFILLLALPWIDAATLPTFIDVNKTITLLNMFNTSFIVKIVYLTLFLLSVYLFVRFIYVLHFIFLQNTSVWQAMKRSWDITKHHQLKLIAYLFMLNVALFLIGFLIVFTFGAIEGILQSRTIGHFIGNYLVEVASFVTLLISLFLFPLNMIMITQLFYRYSSKDEIDLVIHKNKLLKNVEIKIEDFFTNRKLGVKIMIILLLTSMFVINYTISDAVVYLPWDVKVAAHRGDGFHSPENSMSGIKASIEKGIDAIEIDVAMTKDQVMVLSHDKDLNRVVGRSERIQDLSYNELQQVDIGILFDESFAGETMPTLAEVLDYISETETEIIIDVKVVDDDAELYAHDIVELVNAFGVEDLALVQSFNNHFLRIFRELDPDITVGQILFLSAGDLSKLDVDFYTICQTMLTDRFIQQARKENRDVWVWTVNNPRNIKEVLKYDIKGIITDYPERVYQSIH